MGEIVAGELCRLAVHGPSGRVDLSVPIEVPVADLLPALLQGLGPRLADLGLEHAGWVLQRLGEAPLDEDRRLDELGVMDGETLYLRPRSEQIPPLDFDDLIDGIAAGIGDRSALWRPAWTRAAALTVSAIGMATGLVAVALAADTALTYAAGLIAVIALMGGSWVASRRGGDHTIAGLLATGSVAFAGLTTLLQADHLLEAETLDGSLSEGTSLLVAAVVVALTGLFAVHLVAPQRRPAWAVALGTAAALASIAGLLRGGGGADVDVIAAVVLVIVAAIRPSVPLLAFRLSGLRLPPLPQSTDDLQVDIEPEPGAKILKGAAAADDHMTALHVGLAVPATVALLVLAMQPGWLAPTTAVVAAIPPLLALRAMTSAWQRLALGLSSLIAVVAVLVHLTVVGAPWVGPGVVLMLLAVSGSIVAAAYTLPQRPMTPIWGRIGDILHMVALVLMVPLVVGVVGGFALIRSQVG